MLKKVVLNYYQTQNPKNFTQETVFNCCQSIKTLIGKTEILDKFWKPLQKTFLKLTTKP